MKTIRTITVTLFAATAMFAQAPPRKITVQIPFGFHVESMVLPAGQYTVTTEDRSGLMQMRSSDYKMNASVITIPTATRPLVGEGKLLFHRYGNEYFLSTVWTSGDVSGRVLPTTKRELRSAARESQNIETVMARK